MQQMPEPAASSQAANRGERKQPASCVHEKITNQSSQPAEQVQRIQTQHHVQKLTDKLQKLNCT